MGWNGSWQRTSISTVEEMPHVLEKVTGAMATLGYPHRDIFGIRLTLEEAVINAIRHGHQNDPAKQVQVRYRINQDRVLLEIEDQGPGFDPYQIPDPTAPENLENPGGRGLLLMRSFTTWMRFNDTGNCVTCCKRLGDARHEINLPHS